MGSGGHRRGVKTSFVVGSVLGAPHLQSGALMPSGGLTPARPAVAFCVTLGLPRGVGLGVPPCLGLRATAEFLVLPNLHSPGVPAGKPLPHSWRSSLIPHVWGGGTWRRCSGDGICSPGAGVGWGRGGGGWPSAGWAGGFPCLGPGGEGSVVLNIVPRSEKLPR